MIEGFVAATLPSRADAEVSDRALVRFIADGDKAALKVLYLRHRARIYRYLVRLTGSDSIADEVANDVFVAIWRHARQFEGKSQVATKFRVIARFKAVSECRREARSTSASTLIEDPADDPATFVLKRQRSDILQKCLAPLTSLHRDVITLITTREGRARRSLD